MIRTVTISIGPLIKYYPKSNFMFVCGEQECFFLNSFFLEMIWALSSEEWVNNTIPSNLNIISSLFSDYFPPSPEILKNKKTFSQTIFFKNSIQNHLNNITLFNWPLSSNSCITNEKFVNSPRKFDHGWKKDYVQLLPLWSTEWYSCIKCELFQGGNKKDPHLHTHKKKLHVITN